jgi:hypothetical protein
MEVSMSYKDLLLEEIKNLPEEYLPALFEIVRLFRKSVISRSEEGREPWKDLQGSILFYEDPFEPAVPPDDWEVYSDRA